MLFRDLVLISRIPQKTRKSLRATSHVHEIPRCIIHRHSGCANFADCADCADSTCWTTAGDHLNNSNASLLDNWHRSNWVDELRVDLAARSSYSSRSSATSHQASQPLHETPGVPHRNHSSMSKNMETDSDTVRGVLQGTPRSRQPRLSGPGTRAGLSPWHPVRSLCRPIAKGGKKLSKLTG